MTLYTAPRAPMSHPVLIMLHEKGVSFETVYIDPYDKPDWYVDLTPAGQGLVPLLVVDGVALFESTVINEFLEERHPEPPFLPDDPVVRATNRAWTLQAFDLLMQQARLMLAKGRADYEMSRAMLMGRLAKMESQIGSGPFFNGPEIALVDFQYAPVLVRQTILDRVYSTDVLANFEKVRRWTQAVGERASVIATLSPADDTRPFDEVFLPSFYDSHLTTQRAGRLRLDPGPSARG